MATLPKFALGSSSVFDDSSYKRTDDLQRLTELITDPGKPLKWVFSGDSITQGAKHTLGYRAYPEIFAERVRFEMNRSRDIIVNSAISGNTSRDILNDLEWRIKQFKPDVISLMIGTNDAAIARKTSPAVFRQNLIELVDQFRKLGAIPILHTPNTIRMDAVQAVQRNELEQYIQTIREVANKKNIILVDHWTHWEKLKSKVSDENWLNDALHPSGKGHKEMARLLFDVLLICNGKSFACTGK